MNQQYDADKKTWTKFQARAKIPGLFVKANKIEEKDITDENELPFEEDNNVLKPFDGDEARMFTLT